jgi:predicted alpha/beta-fold hydrolase
MPMGRLAIWLFALALTSLRWAEAEPYGYPIENPLLATIIGTPSEHEAPLPEPIKRIELALKVFPKRSIPEIFWYTEHLKYSLAYQEKKAPLIFVIAGIGGNYNSAKMEFLQRAFYQAGFHVVALPSPTHPNFIVSASTTRVPGHIVEDSRDLYAVMRRIWKDIQDRIEISDFFLTGFSLGAAQSAFIARLDESQPVFNFKRVLLINPPVSLYSATRLLDRMLEENVPGGMDHLGELMNEVTARIAEVYEVTEEVTFDEDVLYAAYRKNPPSDRRLAAIIGLAFRLSGANLFFTSDVMTHSGYLVPKNRVLKVSDSLTNYAEVALRISFMDFFNEYFLPYFRSQQPALSEEGLLATLSIKSIESYLASAEQIGLITNADDFILAPGELQYLRDLFKERAKIYPRGGHGGNIEYQENVAYMIDFFRR